MSNEIRETSPTTYIIMGIISIIGGVFVLFNPFAASMSVELLAGLFAIIIGCAQIFLAFKERQTKRFIWHMFIGIIFIALGVLLFKNPLAGIISIAMMVGMAFMTLGFVKVFFSFKLRPVSGWGWVLFSGIMSIILAVMIFTNFPWSTLTILGILLGVEFISNGSTLIFLGMSTRKTAE